MDADACYRALVAHDARFDGIFFVGVKTTGIYCRPVCRARTPRRSSCVFFRRAAEAEREGFRACFRCRPELAPGSSSVDAVSKLARDAVARIEAGALNDASLDDLARDFGVTARHLRRAMQREIGVSPIELAQSCRLSLAKQLLHDDASSIVTIALASGFSSVRRFNTAFRERFGRAPTSLRKHAPRTTTTDTNTITMRLGYREPFAWRAMLEFLAPRATAGVEVVDLDALTYARTVHRGSILVGHDPKRRVLVVEASASLTRSLMAIAKRVRALFDLDAEPRAIDAHLARDRTLRTAVRGTPGLRVPGAFDDFELATRAVLGQQVSVAAATTFAGRFARAFGEPITTTVANLTNIFPEAERVARASEDDLRAIGVTSARARTIIGVARACARTDFTLDGSRDITGIGAWTADYIAMRGLHDPDAFPSGDLALRKALAASGTSDSRAWSPWRAYAAMHLWRQPSGELR